jgi:hypothetical protein
VEAPSLSDAQSKRLCGQFFTTGNPFTHPAFATWWRTADLPRSAIEPFAGAGGIPELLAGAFDSFDIDPQGSSVVRRDTLVDFPTGHDVVVTNPPYLARHFARRKGLPVDHLPWGRYDNLWKVAIDQCLRHARHVAAIIPESFLTSGLFRDRLDTVISLPARMFDDTDMPTCLALWGPRPSRDFEIWCAERRLGTYADLSAPVPQVTSSGPRLTFNVRHGQVGLRAIDSSAGPNIAFCLPAEIADDRVKPTGRLVTRIHVAGLPADAVPGVLQEANHRLAGYRQATADVLLTAFKGVRNDGVFRRRLDYGTARALLSQAIDAIDEE